MNTQIETILRKSSEIKNIKLSRAEKDAIWKNLPTLIYFRSFKRTEFPIINIVNEYSNKIVLAIESNDFETIYEKDSKEFFSPLLQATSIRMLFFQFVYTIMVIGNIFDTGLPHPTEKKGLYWFGSGARTVDDLYRLILNYIPKKYWDYFDVEDIQNILYLLTVYKFIYTHLCPDAAGRVFTIHQSSDQVQFYMSIKRLVSSNTTNNIPIIQEKIEDFVSGANYNTSNVGDITKTDRILSDQYKEFINYQNLKKLLKKGKFTKHDINLIEERPIHYTHSQATTYDYRKIRRDVFQTFEFHGLPLEQALEDYLQKVNKYLKKYTAI